MSTPRWCLILNGKSAGDDALRDAVGALRRRGVSIDVRVTWECGDAERYVAEAISNGVDTVIAGGGDGTLSAIASALAQREETADLLPSLALVALGTANDFATAARIPIEPHAALGLIHATTALPVDLLRIETDDGSHWCANLASGGFGTQVTVETDDGLKKMLGGLAYLITGIARLGRIDPIHARIRGTRSDGTDFAWQGGFIALGIGNGRQAGGGQVLCPDAVIDDHLLDLTIVPELEGEVGATVGALLTEGRQAALDRVALRALLPSVEIDAPRPFTLNLDGEPVKSQRFLVDCVAGRVRMHLPEDCPLLHARGNPLPLGDGHRPTPELPPERLSR